MGHLELTRDWFLHDSLEKRWVRVELNHIITPSLWISKSVVDFAQPVLIVIEALYGQSPHSLIDRSFLQRFRFRRGMKVLFLFQFSFPLSIIARNSFNTKRKRLQSVDNLLVTRPPMRGSVACSVRRVRPGLVGSPSMMRSPSWRLMTGGVKATIGTAGTSSYYCFTIEVLLLPLHHHGQAGTCYAKATSKSF